MTTVLRISAPLLGQIESNKTEVAHIQASELSLKGSALELWTESKKMPVHDDANESSLTFLLLDVPCRLACNIMGPQDNSEKTHWRFSQNPVQLLVKDLTQWPWDPGGSSEEYLCGEIPGEAICYHIRAEIFSPEQQVVLKQQITPVSVDKQANPLPDLISEQGNTSPSVAAKGRPKAHERYFHFNKRAILTIDDVREVNSMDTFLYLFKISRQVYIHTYIKYTYIHNIYIYTHSCHRIGL